MKTTIKHNLIVFHHPGEWYELQRKLVEEHGKSVILIRDKCRRELGFTIRTHKGLVPYLEKWGPRVLSGAGVSPNDELGINFIEKNKNKMVYDAQIHLDFYSEAAMSWFVLKYLNNQ